MRAVELRGADGGGGAGLLGPQLPPAWDCESRGVQESGCTIRGSQATVGSAAIVAGGTMGPKWRLRLWPLDL